MTRAKILIVEDEVMLAKDLARTVERSGYEVVGRVATGEEAVRIAEKTNPDLVLIDIKLKGRVNGIEAARDISSRTDAAVVYLTAHTSTEVFELAKITEPFAFLSKPISNLELERTIEMALYRSRMEKRVKASEQKFRSLYAAMNEGVALHELISNHEKEPTDYRILDVNPAYEAITGISKERAIGSPASELYGTGSPPFLAEFARVAETGEPSSFEVYWEPMKKYFQVSAFSPGKGTFATLLRDITERKRSEAVLKEALEDMHGANTKTKALLRGAGAFLEQDEFEISSRILFDDCKNIIGASSGYVALMSEDGSGNEVVFLDSEGLPCKVDTSLPMPIRGLPGDAYRTGKVVYDNDFSRNKWMEFMPEGHVEPANVLFAPIIIGGKAVGLIGLANKPHGFTEKDAEVAEQFAEFASVGLSHCLARKALERNSEFLITVLESLTHPFYLINADNHLIELANSAALSAGVSSGATCYAATHDRAAPCNDSDHPCPLDQVKATGRPVVVEHLHYDEKGRPRNLEIHAYPVLDEHGKVTRCIEYCLDVTERLQAQQALRENERMLSAVLSLSPSGIAYFREGKLAWANRAMMKLFEYDKEEHERILGKPAGELYKSEEEYERVRELLLSRIAEGKPAEAEARLKRKDGSIFIGSVAVSAQISEDGPGEGTTVVFSDISRRKAAEEERARLATVVEQSAESIVITDREGTIQYVNPAFEKLTQYTSGEAVGQNPRILKSGKHDDQFYREMWETLTRGDIWRGHFVNKKKDGSLFEEEATISPVRDESGNIVNYVGLKRDVTAQVLLERQLQQAQKMESIGTLAGGIAHDFNNLLQIVLGYADMLIMSQADQSSERKHLECIRKAARDGGELVKGLLTFSRQVESKLRPTDLNLELKRIQGMLTRTITRMIDIQLRMADDLAPVNSDPIQVQQVLINLCVNASHAMPDGGRLTIETDNVTLDEEYCKKQLDVEPGEYVLLKIADTGHGMERKVLERVFEPFYTTKKPGEGTGLGLAIVYGIVKNHGGHIICESQPGKGTTFKIYIPAIVTEPASQWGITQQDMPMSGNETILLVDDEEHIRNMVEEFLTRGGYGVLTARDGIEAIEIYRRRKDEIDLVVLDLFMPEMGGEQCLEEILKIDPEATVLVASGYLAGSSTKAVLERRAAGFVNKPFEVREFLLTVRKTLDETGSPGRPVHVFGGLPLRNGEGDGAASAVTPAPPPAPRVYEAPAGAEFPRKLRILAIDDREPYLRMLEAGLLQFGQIPVTASSGVEGLRIFRESHPDLVICDLGMPELDGWEVSRRITEICREKAVPKTPFILLTGQAEKAEIDHEDREKMTVCGVDAIAAKPIDIPDLLEVAEKLWREGKEDSD